MNSEFAKELKQIDNGRFKKIIDTFDSLGDHCKECGYFNPKVEAKYLCRVSGSCPAATLSVELLSYLRWKTGLCSEQEHHNFLGI